MRYKCFTCNLIIDELSLVDVNCPNCNIDLALKPMCSRDNITCNHDIVDSLAYCPDCGEPMCPICGCHDVSQISRITGYMGDVAGFNAGKAQELKDRHRVNISDSE